MIRGIHPVVIHSIFNDPSLSFIYILDLCKKTNTDIEVITNLLRAGEVSIRLIRHQPARSAGPQEHLPKV